MKFSFLLATPCLARYSRSSSDVLNCCVPTRICSVSPLRLQELVGEQRQIVGVASGGQKGAAVCSMLNGKYVNNLILDSKLAEETFKAKKVFDQR